MLQVQRCMAGAATASDPTTLLIATSETPPGLDMEYNGTRSSHEGIAQTIETLVTFDKKQGGDGLLYSDFGKPIEASAGRRFLVRSSCRTDSAGDVRWQPCPCA